MRRQNWLRRALAIAAAVATLPGPAPALAADPAGVVASGPAYDTLGRLAVMHEGRVKPLDTVAREEIKQIYGRETIKLTELRDEANKVLGKLKGEPVAQKWGAVAAWLDWSVRPEFWDDQPFLLVQSLPLKEMVLADAAKRDLTAIAAKKSTPAAVKDELTRLVAKPTVSGRDLWAVVKHQALPDDDQTTLAEWTIRLGEEHKWLSPSDLIDARLTINGKTVTFEAWFQDIRMRSRPSSPMARPAKLPPLEEKAQEVGVRLAHYQMLRGDREVSAKPIDMFIPRPHDAAYLKFTADALAKLRTGHGDGRGALTPLESDSLQTLQAHFLGLQKKDRHEPGTDAEADKQFETWLQVTADWVPLRLIVDSDPKELERAGFPARETAAFRDTYTALRASGDATPGKLDPAKAAAFVAAARALGEPVGLRTSGQSIERLRLVDLVLGLVGTRDHSIDWLRQAGLALGLVGPSHYPTPTKMGIEATFNQFGPFFKAPYAFGTALVCLLICLGVPSDAGRRARSLRKGLYLVGMAGFVGGVLLEVYGFAMRVMITGWSPVTNMYETVIWVALMASVLGLVLELIGRKVYPAAAASGVALLATILAANTPLLDPEIHQLQPVLRSNYWLAIHVLTIVSSYAAFALTMGLGLIATMMYLTATYRRDVGYGELLRPLVPGLPLFAAGVLGMAAAYTGNGPAWTQGVLFFYLAAAPAAVVGGSMIITALVAAAGEFLSRLAFRDAPEAEIGAPMADEATTATATLTKPTVAEIRARALAATPLKLDPRAEAMRRTAASIKPVASFIYRAMQVGVLLVAAGTILGGVWADYSWGRFWGWDSKEVAALVTLLVYLAPLHGRFAGWVNTFGLVCASVLCFGAVLFAWYGVNFVLGVGLHSYGFVEGGSQGVVFYTSMAVASVVFAAAWRRRLASRPVA